MRHADYEEGHEEGGSEEGGCEAGAWVKGGVGGHFCLVSVFLGGMGRVVVVLGGRMHDLVGGGCCEIGAGWMAMAVVYAVVV